MFKSHGVFMSPVWELGGVLEIKLLVKPSQRLGLWPSPSSHVVVETLASEG